MAHGCPGSGPKKHNNDGLMELEQGRFPVVGVGWQWFLELRQRRWRWCSRGRPGSRELTARGQGRGSLTGCPLLAGQGGGKAGGVRSALGGVGGTVTFEAPRPSLKNNVF